MKFIFRGLDILEYNEETKQVEVPMDNDAGFPYFNMCKFIPEDYVYIAEFFNAAYKDTQGVPVELKDIEVN